MLLKLLPDFGLLSLCSITTFALGEKTDQIIYSLDSRFPVFEYTLGVNYAMVYGQNMKDNMLILRIVSALLGNVRR